MGMLCSSSALIIPIWARPFAPPPLSTSPTRWAWESSGTSKRIIYITSLLKGMSFFKVKQILSKKHRRVCQSLYTYSISAPCCITL